MSRKSHVLTLDRRRAWLHSRVDTGGWSPSSLAHMKAEIAALTWALPVLEQVAEDEAVIARDPAVRRRAAAMLSTASAALAALADSDRATYDRLIATADASLVSAVDVRRFGARVPSAAPMQPETQRTGP